MRKYLLAAAMSSAMVSLFLACSGSSPKETADAAKAVDADSNLAFGDKCTTVSNMSTECASGVCTNTFNMLTYNVCSKQCTMLGEADPTECPVPSDGSGSAFCNMKGYCKPF